LPGTDITRLLRQASSGDRDSLDAVFTHLYPELRAIAQNRLSMGERTLTPTSLVHEAWLRLGQNPSLTLESRRHFLACAARAMRVIVVDHWRAETAAKRGGTDEHLTLDTGVPAAEQLSADMLSLDQVLTELQAINPHQHQIVEMHYFGGVEFVELARLFDCSERTVRRDWQRARAFLHARLGETGSHGTTDQ
jgi:RNA polymerase sigma factor (TIGR02999 family)